MATNVVEFAMKKKWKAAIPWNRLVIVLEHSRFSLKTQSFFFLFVFLRFNSVCVFQFAHRYCIQRWCDEKGNTTCEICLQVKKIFVFLFVIYHDHHGISPTKIILLFGWFGFKLFWLYMLTFQWEFVCVWVSQHKQKLKKRKVEWIVCFSIYISC